MERKHLHELLREDQEPFQLKSFIADSRRRLKSTATTGSGAGAGALQSRKRKPIIESTSSSTAARNFCVNHVCLFSFQDSPDSRKSPLIDFPAKSPCSNNNNSPQNATVLLHIPARTAAVLLDAATRVKSGSSKNIGFGLFGSFLKRLKDRSTRTKTREIGPGPGPGNATACSPPTRRSRNNSRRRSADWSEKSSEMETSCSSRSILDSERDDNVLDSCEKCSCSSPASPFRFSLQTSPSPGRWKQELISPVVSPSRHFRQDEKSCEDEIFEEINGEGEEEKEQSSPVSVLDLPFDDDEEHDGGAVEEDDYDIECSYASVQRAKHQLLQKLRRFERLAELDPIELEKHMFEQFDNEDDDDQEEATNKDFMSEIIDNLGVTKIPWYMKKLVLDLVAEETKNEEQKVVKNVCKKLHSWKVVESNTIDMMVEMDFQSEGWKNNDDEIREIGMDVEIAIFGFLMEELAQEMGY